MVGVAVLLLVREGGERDIFVLQLGGIGVGLEFYFALGQAFPDVEEVQVLRYEERLALAAVPVEKVLAEGERESPIAAGGLRPFLVKLFGVIETTFRLRVQDGIRIPCVGAWTQRLDERRAVCGKRVPLRELHVREPSEIDGIR